MAKDVNPARMTFKLEFGKQKATNNINPNTGEAIKGFIPDFELWAGQWSLTTDQTISLAGAGIKNAAVFFVRHNISLNESMQVRRDKTTVYQIDSISFDDGLPPDGFDLITCHKLVNTHA